MRRISAVEIIAFVGFAIGTAFYTYHSGWLGLLYSLLSFVLGVMIVYWFGDLFPIIGPLMRRGRQEETIHETTTDGSGAAPPSRRDGEC